MDIPRLNGAIKALESGKPTFVTFAPGEVATAVNNAAALLQPETGLEPGHSSDPVRGSALLSV